MTRMHSIGRKMRDLMLSEHPDDRVFDQFGVRQDLLRQVVKEAQAWESRRPKPKRERGGWFGPREVSGGLFNPR